MTYPYQACSSCAAASFESASVRFTKAKLTPYGVRKFDQFFLRSAIRWGVLAKRAKKPEVSTTIRKRAFEAWAFSLSSAIKRPWTSVSGVDGHDFRLLTGRNLRKLGVFMLSGREDTAGIFRMQLGSKFLNSVLYLFR